VKGIVIGIAVTAIAFAILATILPQVKLDGDVAHLILLSIVFGVANSLIKPIVKMLSFPINMMTLGLFGLVINVGLLLGVAWAADKFLKVGFTIGGFPTHGIGVETIVTAVIASIALGLISAVIGLVVHD
jgi:putative membrane protein